MKTTKIKIKKKFKIKSEKIEIKNKKQLKRK